MKQLEKMNLISFLFFLTVSISLKIIKYLKIRESYLFKIENRIKRINE